MARTLDIFQARDLAREIVNELGRQNIKPVQGLPNTIEHISWMANEVAIGRLSDENQANRWIGYVQAGLIFLAWSDMATELSRVVRFAATDDYPLSY